MHLSVNLGIVDFMGSDLLALYFWFSPLHPSDFEAFLGDFSVLAVVDVSMDTVGFYIITSCYGIRTNYLIVSLLYYSLNDIESNSFLLPVYKRSNTILGKIFREMLEQVTS